MADAVEWKFKAEWFDERSSLTKDFVLTYYLNAKNEDENEVSLFDIKARRPFLKRTTCNTVKKEQLFLGSKVLVYSRQLKLVDYADSETRRALGVGHKTLLCDIPASAYQYLGQILSTVQQNGFTLAKLKSVREGPSDPSNACGFFVLCEVVGKVQSGEEDLKSQVFKGASGPGIAQVQVMEKSAQSDGIFSARTTTATFNDCSLLIIKPHAVKEGLAGAILSSILEASFQISAIELFNLSRSEAQNFSEVYKGVLNPQEFTGLVTELCGGPCIAVELRSEACVQRLRDLCGPHDVEVAKALRPDSLRARFGSSNLENAVHCTDLPEDGVLESQYFFEILVGTKQ